MEFFEITYWHWWIVAAVLMVLEVLVPGTFFFLWVGIAAVITGWLAWIFPTMSLEVEIVLFAILSVVSAVVWRLYVKHYPTKTDRPNLNLRVNQYIGRIFTLENPIVNGYGKVKVDDSTWKISGEDCPAKTRVSTAGSTTV